MSKKGRMVHLRAKARRRAIEDEVPFKRAMDAMARERRSRQTARGPS